MANSTGERVLSSVVSSALDAASKFGKAALHTIAPDNFEYYMCSLELLNSSGDTKGFMNFVVMPNSILESKTQIITITKTNNGIATLFNTSFVTRDISIQGTFGRKFRLLTGMTDPTVSDNPVFNGNLGFNFMGGEVLVKTGYGITKMLKAMVENSSNLDELGNPHLLIFNNYALNTHYVVEVLQSSFSQSVENNMMWYYSLEMKAIAPASAIKIQKNMNSKLLTDVASSGVADSITDLLGSLTRSIGF